MPEQALQRLLRDPARTRRDQGRGNQGAGEPDLEETLLPDLPDSKPTLLQQAEAEILACVLAKPDLLVDIDFDETPLEVREVVQLFDWVAEALALGRNSGADVFRYLFTRATDEPGLQSMLALAHGRADRMKEPGEVLFGIMDGRRHKLHGSRRRSLREQYLAAIQAGDSETAAELQQKMLESKRREQPRKGIAHGGAAPAPSANRAPPAFGFAAKVAAQEAVAPHSPVDPPSAQPVETAPVVVDEVTADEEGPPLREAEGGA